MRELWTIIGVDDVARSFAWYQTLLGLPKSAPAHEEFGRVVDEGGAVVLCVHEWEAHGHPTLTSPRQATPGNGLILFFRVGDFEAALVRARALVGELAEEPHRNPNTETSEFALRDPDGYYVMVDATDDRPHAP